MFYWIEVEWGGSGLTHNEEAEAFYSAEGELTVSPKLDTTCTASFVALEQRAGVVGMRNPARKCWSGPLLSSAP
jgi:hypothetical protein